MAEKKNAEALRAEEKQTVTVRIDAPRDGELEVQFVSVNGKTYQVNKGEDVEVPIEVAEVLVNSVEAMGKYRAYVKSKEYKVQ